MKKLLGAVLCAALLVPSGPLSAELLKNLKVNGSIEAQAVSANNATDFNTAKFDQIGDVQTRTLLNMDWDLLDDVHSKVSLTKNDHAWGTASQPVTANAVNAGITGNLMVDQANLKIDKMVGNIDATLGRQFYGSPRDLVAYFGPKDGLYGMAVTALDAVRFDWALTDMLGLTGIVGKVASHGLTTGGAVTTNTSDATGAPNTVDLRGVTATCKGANHSVGAYLYNQVTHLSAFAALPVRNDYLYVLGFKGHYMMGNWWVNGELAKNFGQDRFASGNGAYTGTALLASTGYKADVHNFGGVNPWFELGLGSGGNAPNKAFMPIAGDYRPGGIYGLFSSNSSAPLGNGSGLGTVSSNSLGDRAIWGLGVKATPSKWSKLTAGLSFWDYRFQTVATGAAGTPAAAAGNKHIGSEVDLNATWAKSDNVSIGATIGSFQPGGAIKNAQAANNPAVLFSSDVSVKF